ncbi:MAG: hypothetical protein JWP01_3654 [Myxococcales bacterium]|nr:hypothetical protein [Myxococcales bacterium]
MVAPVRRVALPPALGPPAAIHADVRGAAYLTAVAKHIQPNWEHFLEDCRVRLAPSHPLNELTLAATATLVIDRAGKVSGISIETSGSADFDRAVRDVLADAPRVEPPPVELLSDDDRVHVRWLFARDLRQAGAATAALLEVEGAVLDVTDRLLAQGELARAARRIARAASSDPDRLVAAERVMIAALREALGSMGAGARKAAVEAIGRASVRQLAAPIRALISPTIDTELRLAAIVAVAQLEDQAAVDVIAGMLPGDLQHDPRLAQAETTALVALGQRARATSVVRRALESAAAVTALRAHAVAPDLSLAPKLLTWFTRGDARTRAAVCAAIPADWDAQPVVLRGLRDPDATVRAACAETIARQARGSSTRAGAIRVGSGALARLRELARDRDQVVRARAVGALAILEPRRIARASSDPAPEVRAAAVAAATEPELRSLAVDADPDVRAAALAMLGERSPELLVRAASDLAPQVRRAVIDAITDEEVLTRLASDDSPEVATAALVELTTRRGRAAMATTLLDQLAVAPSGSAERARIALAFLLGR